LWTLTVKKNQEMTSTDKANFKNLVANLGAAIQNRKTNDASLKAMPENLRGVHETRVEINK